MNSSDSAGSVEDQLAIEQSNVQGHHATGVTYCRAGLVLSDKGISTYFNMYVRYRDELVKHGSHWLFLKREYDVLCFTEAISTRHLATSERGKL